jgi:replicative DNA helicase
LQISKHILAGILNNKAYAKKVYPHLKKDYFRTFEEGYVFNLMKKYMIAHKAFPTKSSLLLELSDVKDLNETGYNEVKNIIENIADIKFDYTEDYLIKATENFCKTSAINNALLKSIELQEKNENVDSIPDILRKALQVNFDSSCGFEIFDEKSMDERFNLYQRKVKKFSTGLQRLDELTDGGLEAKAITVIFGGSGVGKSAALVAIAANMARNGENVLYITLEMSEEKISQRFEANFLDEYINNISKLDEEEYKSGLCKLKSDTLGRIVVKEFPTATINSNHVNALIDELEIKRNFKPTVVVVDYINLMRSSRFANENSYVTVKGITEELRGIAVEREICMISATQANKEGNNSKLTDLDATQVAESNGLLATVDLLIGLIFSEELREQSTQIWKILKNRFSGFVNSKFPIKVEHDKSKIYDCDDDMQIYGNNEINEKLDKEKKQSKKKKVEVKFKKSELADDLWD